MPAHSLSRLPEYRDFLVYCDDTGINKPFYGWGSFWIPSEARGRLSGWVAGLREEYGFFPKEEIKWNGISRQNRSFYEALVDGFFDRNWMMFHGLVVKKALVNRGLHAHMGEARMKHLATLLADKIAFFAKGRVKKAYHVRVDPLGAHSGYPKEDEKLHVITNSMLRRQLGFPAIHSLSVTDSKTSVGVQLADVLLGAVVAPWQGPITSEHKRAVSALVYQNLGWADHLADTKRHVWKFNIWHFYDPTAGVPRYVKDRPVNFRKAPIAYRRH